MEVHLAWGSTGGERLTEGVDGRYRHFNGEGTTGVLMVTEGGVDGGGFNGGISTWRGFDVEGF